MSVAARVEECVDADLGRQRCRAVLGLLTAQEGLDERMRPPQHGKERSGVFGSSGLGLAALMASIGMSGTESKVRMRAMLLARVWQW